VRLLDRSTRRVGVTEIGMRFLEEARAGLGAIERAVDAVADSRESPAGLLRLNLPRVVADIVVIPHLADFARAYPDVTVEMHCDNRFIDLVAAGFDAGFRLGESLANDVVAVPIGRPNRLATFASPGYIAAHGAPATPAELLGHRCVCIRLDHDRSIERWEYAIEGRIVEVAAGPSIVSNDGDLLLAAAREGLGVGCHLEAIVATDLANGTLVPVLTDYWPTFGAFHLYYPSRVHMPRKLRVFIDFLRQRHAT
ncbi:MAG: LysR substrate-binding domain-containing protein, partial [Luteibacter sp.]